MMARASAQPREATKRDAAIAAQQAELAAAAPTICTDASGARIRTVGVHLTPFAPGARELPLDHPRRWHVFYGVSPSQVLRATLKRLRQSPRALTAALETAPDLDGRVDVSLMGHVPAEHLRQLSGDPEHVPFAIFYDGLSLAETAEALAQLVAAGWEPPAPLPQNI